MTPAAGLIMRRHRGRGLMQLPGPTNVPAAVLSAIGEPTLDHRGKPFAALVRSVLGDVATTFGTAGPVALYPGSGSGGWEAALVNTLAGGDRVAVCRTGYFSDGWASLASKLGLDVVVVPGRYGQAADPVALGRFLSDPGAGGRDVRAVLVVHNETSTGVTTDVGAVRRTLDDLGHPALLFVDAVSSLGAMPVDHDGWRADVTITASQKGLMLPPGLVLLAVSEKARATRRPGGLPCGYWEWEPMLSACLSGSFPYTPSSNLIVGLRVALDLIADEGLDRVFRRHRRLADATSAAAEHWGLSLVCEETESRSSSVTAVQLPPGVDESAIRDDLVERFAVTVGGGLGELKGRCLRIGHLGDVDELMVVSTIASIEAILRANSVPIVVGGVDAAMNSLEGTRVER